MEEMFFGAYAFNQDISLWNPKLVKDVSLMFCSALMFNYSLCSWGAKLQPSTNVDGMFDYTNCPTNSTPDMSITPRGPFCYECTTNSSWFKL